MDLQILLAAYHAHLVHDCTLLLIISPHTLEGCAHYIQKLEVDMEYVKDHRAQGRIVQQ